MRFTKTPSKVFIDINVFVYMSDPTDPAKRHTANEVVARHRREGTGSVSVQVMQELCSVLVRKGHLSLADAKEAALSLRSLEVVSMTPELFEQGADVALINRISIWDGLIVAAAKASNCSEIYSEDLQHGGRIAGIRIVNPFVPA